MVLQYMLSGPRAASHEPAKCKMKAKRKVLICLLLLSYLIVGNIGYNLWVAEEGTPVWKLFTVPVICDLWAMSKNTATMPGVVMGILYSDKDSCALINHEHVHEGDVTDGVKIIKIGRGEVEFEKAGQKWTQRVLTKPNSAWKATEISAE
ncbi:MAG: hypothetical protein PHY02_04840 [Phycisphaerae bacterium]|nr:hypothetical protein [Phycisphaerae bacterium]